LTSLILIRAQSCGMTPTNAQDMHYRERLEQKVAQMAIDLEELVDAAGIYQCPELLDLPYSLLKAETRSTSDGARLPAELITGEHSCLCTQRSPVTVAQILLYVSVSDGEIRPPDGLLGTRPVGYVRGFAVLYGEERGRLGLCPVPAG
jgi:hypothetical protein